MSARTRQTLLDPARVDEPRIGWKAKPEETT